MTRVLLYCNATASAAIKTYLEYKGFEVVAPNGDGSGRYQIQAGEFALAIVDVGVSASAGLGVIKAMRDADAELGIIAISAPGPQHVHEPGCGLAVAAGASGVAQFLSAPFHPSELLQVMNNVLAAGTGRRVFARRDEARVNGPCVALASGHAFPGNRAAVRPCSRPDFRSRLQGRRAKAPWQTCVRIFPVF